MGLQSRWLYPIVFHALRCALTVESGRGRVATEATPSGEQSSSRVLSQPSEQSPERDGRTKRWARVRDGRTRLN